MPVPIIDEKQLPEILQQKSNPFFKQHFAFYSSWYGGIIKSPHLMLLPMDDHMVHRGDGVFEGIKVVGGFVYLLDEHLTRLMDSAKKILLTPTLSVNEMQEIILETLRAANRADAMIRVYLSRGPGGFAINPYDSVAPQFYVVITELKSPAVQKYEDGVIIGKSNVHIYPSRLAQAKSCNYIPNVLMKSEAVERGLDFVIGTDENGHFTEGPTENLMIVDKDGFIVHPKLDYILKGTMMIRACELARENGYTVNIRDITLEDLHLAREIMMVGTTLNILPVTQFEEQKIGNGKPGPVAKKLHSLILNDIATGSHSIKF